MLLKIHFKTNEYCINPYRLSQCKDTYIDGKMYNYKPFQKSAEFPPTLLYYFFLNYRQLFPQRFNEVGDCISKCLVGLASQAVGVYD